MRRSFSIILLLLSSALSKSTLNDDEPSTTKPKTLEEATFSEPLGPKQSKQLQTVEEENSGSIETLFIPEDLNRHGEILDQVRKLLVQSTRLVPDENDGARERTGSGGESRRKFDDVATKFTVETRSNSRENSGPKEATKDADQLPKLDLRETTNNSGYSRNGEKYLAGNSSTDFVESNRDSVDVAGKSNTGNLGDREKIEEAEARGDQEIIGPDDEDFVEAANFGLEAMNNLYFVKEPKLYSMGLYLDADNPAKFVAAFNDQSEEARTLAKYGFAVLQGATMFQKKFPDARKNMLLSRQSQRNPLQLHCPSRGTPNCPPASRRYRTSDGSCNNLQHPWWGSAMSTMQRFLPPVYQDGIQSIRLSKTGSPLPSARLVSNIFHENKDVSLASVTHMLMQWGQFIDHDITATGQSRGFNGTIPQCCLNFGLGFQPPEFMHPECLPIAISPQDSFFGPLGVRCLEFLRSGSAPKENCQFGPREQLSQVTSYVDASTVYSSNVLQSDTLRLFRNGLLQYGKLQSQRPVLPRQDTDLCRQGSLSVRCFRAGDGRLSEQPALTSLHVVFLRLHNRIATNLAALNPHWSDEKLYQESRRIVGAVLQHVTYREFLPIILGQKVVKIFDLEVLKKGYYEGYDPTANPTIANAFSTAAYRFGHSLVQRSFVRYNRFHQPIFNNVSIHEEFTNPVNLETAGSVDRLLLGLLNQPSQRRDEHITDELTNHLFQTSNFPFGMDLASLNIQRGRDHGIPPYVQWRQPCGLSAINSFDDLNRVMPASTVKIFRLIYASVEDIDLFSAGLAENSVAGGLVGPTFACIIGQQFRNLRRGDRFWYENPGLENSFTPSQLQQIRRVSLAQVLCKTMDDIDSIQPFAFLMPDSLRNQRLSCEDPAIGQLNLEFWAERASRSRSASRSRGLLDKLKRKGQSTTAKPTTQAQSVSKNTPSALDDEKSINLSQQNPPRASIVQKNRVVVNKPLGPPDNVTVFVQNNAHNSPVFVKDAIYGSNIKLESPYQTTSRPSLDFVVQKPRPPAMVQPPLDFPSFIPPAKPIPTSPPLGSLSPNRPYVPYAYEDPNNPNPLNHGYQSSYVPSDIVFEGYPGTTPRPTLYTYYTNYQRPTQKPLYEEYNNHGPQSHGSYVQDRPLPPVPQYETAGQLSKPLPNNPGNQYPHNGNNYGLPNWQSWHQTAVNQHNDPGHWNTQGYRVRPQQSSQQSDWNSQGNRYKPSEGPLVGIRGDRGEYTTPVDVVKDYNRPVYQVQADPNRWSTVPTYQKEPPRPEFNYNKGYQGGRRDSVETLNSAGYQKPDKPLQSETVPPFYPVTTGTPYFEGNQPYRSTHKAFYDRPDHSEGSYKSVTQPSKIYSVTIVAEAMEEMNQGGYEADRTENGVSSEVPRPLIDQVDENRPITGRPGQYYYEKNVLHRYPDKIELPPPGERHYSFPGNVEQRHKASVDKESTAEDIAHAFKVNETDQSTWSKIVDERANVTSFDETIDRVEIESNSDDVDGNLEALAKEVESITSAGGYV